MNEATRTQQITARKNKRIHELEAANAELAATVLNQERRIWRLTRLTVVN